MVAAAGHVSGGVYKPGDQRSFVGHRQAAAH
jgi:hypothetical protein